MVRSWLSVLLSLPCVALDASASADVGQTWVQENGARRSPPFHQGGGIASLTIATEDQVATMSSTSPTSTVAPCGALEACLAHTNCSRCFTAIRPFLGQAVETLAQDHLQREFYTTLIRTPLCGLNSTPETLLFPALDVLSRRPNGEKPLPCSQKFGLTIDSCQMSEYEYCFTNPSCQECLSTLYDADLHNHSVPKFYAPQCLPPGQDAIPALWNTIISVSENCAGFPRCSWAKVRCFNWPACRGCWDAVIRGDIPWLKANCSAYNELRNLFESLLADCDVGPTACLFYTSLCEDTPDCMRCLNAIQVDQGPEQFAAAFEGACTARFANGNQNALLNRMLTSCHQPGLACAATRWTCVTADHDRDGCLGCLRNPDSADNASCTQAFKHSGVYAACKGCPGSVQIANRLVVATAVVGGMSAALCLAVVGAIMARGHDRVSIRDRIVIGLLMANTLYSCANAVPASLLGSTEGKCGTVVMGFAAMRITRAVWFFGKYALVGFEVVILGVSTWVLVRGGRGISRRIEALLYTLSLILGAAAFVSFYLLAARISNQGYNAEGQAAALDAQFNHLNDQGVDDLDDTTPIAASAAEFADARANYDELVQRMLQVWNGLLGVAILMWVGLRWALRVVLRRWRALSTQLALDEASDEWVQTRSTVWQERWALVEQQWRSFDEIARPLEGFVLVFVAFGLPAIVMSTDWCQSQSGASNAASGGYLYHAELTYGLCDAGCELALSFRSAAIVVTYLLQGDRRRRAELLDVRGTLKGLFQRVCGSTERAPIPLDDLTPPPPDHRPDRRDWQIDCAELCFDEKIGEGGAGTVWAGSWRGAGSVAIKIVKSTATVDDDGELVSPTAWADFERECAALLALRHPNLLTFYGYSTSKEGWGLIVTEMMDSSLRNVLDDARRELPWRWRASVALQLASGMSHLHAIPLIHRDLKSANVLLDADGRAVVADLGTATQFRPRPAHVVVSAFTGTATVIPAAMTAESGASKHLLAVDVVGSGDRVMTKAQGTISWMAPEVFRGDCEYTSAVDVYSFGVVLYELATRREPWAELDALAEKSPAKFFNEMLLLLQTGQRPMVPSELCAEHPEFVSLMRWCWEGDPARRPTFSSALPRLAACLRSECVDGH